MIINGKHIMFKAESNQIRPYEIVKETPLSVSYKKEKFVLDINAPKEYFIEIQRKENKYHFWAETFEEARKWIVDGILKEIKLAQATIERENKYLESVKALVEPKIIVK